MAAGVTVAVVATHKADMVAWAMVGTDMAAAVMGASMAVALAAISHAMATDPGVEASLTPSSEGTASADPADPADPAKPWRGLSSGT